MTNEGRDSCVTLISRHRHSERKKFFSASFTFCNNNNNNNNNKMGNGAKAQMKRERNAKQNQKKEGASQLKANAAAKNIICKTCFQTFLCTFVKRRKFDSHVSISSVYFFFM
ncbi:unnamed protein product [Rhizopus microsporus]